MRFLNRFASVLSWILRRDRAEALLDDEARSFVEMSTADKIADGVPDAEARRLALIEMGGVEQVKEQVRAGRHGALLDDIGRDVRYAFRLFARQRTFAVVIVVTLALGVGANTAIFSIIDGLMLRTLPVADPGRLVQLAAAPPSDQRSWTYPIWEEIKRQDVRDGRFGGAFAWTREQFDLSTGGESRFVNGAWASAGAFDVLGVKPARGRLFQPSDDDRGGGSEGPVVVISHAFWRTHFGGAPDAIGRTLTLERVPLRIVGVTPPGFFGLTPGRSLDVVIPLGVEPLIRGGESRLDRRTSWWLQVFVRLKRGQSIEAATAVMQTLQPGIREATLPPPSPGRDLDQYLADAFTFENAARGPSGLRDEYSRPLLILMAVVGLVLLIACANIANLLLARATARSHEWSVRLALGASRGRLARQLLLESLLLGAMGAAAGVVVAHWGSGLLVAQLATDAVSLELPLDWRMLAFTAGTGLIAALVFGVAPAWRAARGAPIDAMKDRGRTPGASHTPLASGLVLAQVVLSLVLLIGAGLFLRSFTGLTRAPLGFERGRVLLGVIDARRADLAPAARLAAYDRIHQRVLAVPGVEQAAVSITAPLGAMWSRRIDVSGSALRGTDAPGVGPEGFGFTDRPIPVNAPLSMFNGITSGWIATFGTPLLAGRDISDRDGPGSPRVALVNQAFARKFLGGANPVGHTMQPTGDPGSPPIEIVGLLADAVYRDVREPALPTAYVPLSQSVDKSLVEDPTTMSAPAIVTLSVRHSTRVMPRSLGTGAAVKAGVLTKSVASAIGEIDPTLAVTFEPLDNRLSDALTTERLLAILSASFGVLALLMAAVGLYGVTSYAVSLRRTEIGIRMALGATRASVVRLVLGRVSRLIGIGMIVGLAIGAWASRFVATLLYGLEPGDPVTLVAAATTLALIGAIAGWLPANRASRLDPTRVLHDG
jgi:putative ABC transport system permease protein